MENELHIQVVHSSHIPTFSESNFACLNPQLDTLTGLPTFSPLQQQVPSELVFSDDYSDSSIPTTLISSDFDGLICDHNRLLSEPELNCGASTSGFEPWVLPNYVTMDSSHVYYGKPPSHSQSQSGLEHGSNSKFSTVLSGSSYLGVLEHILSDIASFSLESTSLVSSNHFADSTIPLDEYFEDDGSFEARAESSYRRLELESKKWQLLGLLQMLDDCYNQCLDDVHSKTSELHAAGELDPQIHSSYALRTVAFFYKNLRERISNQIPAMGSVVKGSAGEKERSFEKCFIQKQWALQQLKRRDQQLWRPQRGLPERSVSVLRAWMFENFLHPYPKDSEKHLLAIKSGLTRSQVSNWFINARVRLWKPLVEEMSSELNRRRKCHEIEEGSNKSVGS